MPATGQPTEEQVASQLKQGNTVNIEPMVQRNGKIVGNRAIDREVARLLRGAATAVGLTLCGLPMLAQQQTQASPSGNQPRPTQTGPSSGPQSSAMVGAQQQLYTASGQNGAQVSQDSFKGSIVEGKATGNVLDLSL
ncbi:MAG TPA: hypothetical protein VHN81_00845, partial [Edaphobacter sp.]|nr:hypothetical protein [Edaphobacter sp.]